MIESIWSPPNFRFRTLGALQGRRDSDFDFFLSESGA
jgi:hypothetical protein